MENRWYDIRTVGLVLVAAIAFLTALATLVSGHDGWEWMVATGVVALSVMR